MLATIPAFPMRPFLSFLHLNPVLAASAPRGGLLGWSSPVRADRPRSRQRARGLALLALPVVGVLGIWSAIRVFPGFGPALADGLRATIGSEAVTALEELSAEAEDRLRLAVDRSGARGLSDVTPEEVVALSRQAPAEPDPRVDAAPAFRPRDVGPLFPAVASPEDGQWQPVPVATGEGEPLHRTLVHPDPKRPYAELFVFALDLSRVKLHFVPGSREPKGLPGAQTALPRPGRVPEGELGTLIAAFNGGFKSEHGQFGMQANGVEIAPPRPGSCTVAASADGALRIGTWSSLRAQSSSFTDWRQTPACMVENGALHPGLTGDSTRWGATIDGDTVIRRSAVGLDRERRTLFVAISNATTARALATGMMHVGAHDVAQLDVNHSYPRFVLYRHDGAEGVTAMTAVKGFSVDRDAYVGRASPRDFFYVTVRPG